jgi:hypothetical protein
VPGLGAWWQAKLLRERAPSVQAWWPVSSVSPATTFFLYAFAHDLNSEPYRSDMRFFIVALSILVTFLPQWALLQAARIRLAWLWIVVPAICCTIVGFIYGGGIYRSFVAGWGIDRSDMHSLMVGAWLLSGAIMGPLIYWQTRRQSDRDGL